MGACVCSFFWLQLVKEEGQKCMNKRVNFGERWWVSFGERRSEVELHQLEQRPDEPLGLSEGQVEDQAQGQSGLDGYVRVRPLPTSFAVAGRRPRDGSLLGEPDGDVTTIPETLLVLLPVLHAVFGLVGRVDVAGFVVAHGLGSFAGGLLACWEPWRRWN